VWNVPKKLIYTVVTKTTDGRTIIQCALTDKESAEDTLSDLESDKPEYHHYLVPTDLYIFDE
jgi:hypothetical protein